MKSVRYIFWIVLFPLALIWSTFYIIRRKFFTKTDSVDLPIISVGNLHVGGSGKTPIVLSLAKHFREAAILSRGYKGSLSKLGAKVDLQAKDGPSVYGDEPWMMAHLSQMPVFIGKKRINNVAKAKEHGAKILILDDGFQHLAVSRNLDIVAINVDYTLDDNYCLPLGSLREPFSALGDCHLVVLVCDGKSEKVDVWKSWLTDFFPSQKIVEATRTFSGYWQGDKPFTLPNAASVSSFCGVAKPESFCREVKASGFHFLKAFPDHHSYSPEDVRWLINEGKTKNSEIFLTTDKDWYKVSQEFSKQGKTVVSRRLDLELPTVFWETVKEGIRL